MTGRKARQAQERGQGAGYGPWCRGVGGDRDGRVTCPLSRSVEFLFTEFGDYEAKGKKKKTQAINSLNSINKARDSRWHIKNDNADR